MRKNVLSGFCIASILSLIAEGPLRGQDGGDTIAQTDGPAAAQNLDRADSLNQEGLELVQAGKYAEAEPLFAEVLRLHRQIRGERHPDTLNSLYIYASVLFALGRANEAEPLHAELLRLNQEALGERHPDTLASLNNYAFVLESIGRSSEAEPLFAEALRLRREVLGERHPDTLTSLNNYAAVLDSLGRAIEAEPFFAETLRLRREVLGERHRDTLSSLDQYAGVLDSFGRANEAEPLYAEVLRLRREMLGGRHRETLASINNYGFVLDRLGRASEAEPLFDEALRLRREILGERHPETLLSLNNYAGILQSLGRFGEAEPLFAEALRLYRELLGERHPDTLTSLNNYALNLLVQGRTNEAEPLFAETLRLRREVLGEQHPDTLNSLNSYAQISEMLGNYSAALPLARERVLIGRSRVASLSVKGPQAQTEGQRENEELQLNERLLADVLWANSVYEKSLTASDRREAFIALQFASSRSASRAVAEAAVTRYASGQGLETIVRERQALTGEWVRNDALLIATLAEGGTGKAVRDSLLARIAEIETRMKVIDERLRSEAPQYFRILNQPAIDLDEARAMLQPDEAVLLIVPTERGTHIMALTQEKLDWARADLNDEDIAAAVRNLRDGLEVTSVNLPYFDLASAHELYEALIAPIAETIEGTKRLYVVADGELSRLPVGVLLATAPPAGADSDDPDVLRSADWLADRFALVQIPSLQSLAYIRTYGASEGAGPKTSFMGFGDPVLEGEARLRGARSGTISAVDAADLVGDITGDDAKPLMNPAALRTMARLPGTERELEDVRSALPSAEATLFLGANMTETAIRSANLSSVNILHLATHGLTSEESGERAEPGLVFTPPSVATLQDDGYLSASEVVGLNLTSAQWIIMSACNTASPSGKAGESGLSGLSRAFFYAGAPTLLVSHWPVFDDVAAKLTVGALTRAEAGMPRAEALQAAMIEIRGDESLDAAHPAVWAPFTLVGEGM